MSKEKKTIVVPAMTVINRKTGESITKYVEVDEEEYNKAVIDPFARSLLELMKKDIESGKFKSGQTDI